jgi:uncharacterized protein YjbJ (UPF0337 family)
MRLAEFNRARLAADQFLTPFRCLAKPDFFLSITFTARFSILSVGRSSPPAGWPGIASLLGFICVSEPFALSRFSFLFGKTSSASKIGETAMDWNRFEGNWKQFSGRVKEKWGKLTDDDLDVINGRREQLEGKIQERYGIAKDQVRRDVDDWLKSMP